MSVSAEKMREDARALTARWIEYEAKRNPLDGYASLARAVIEYLEVLEMERGWRFTPATEAEHRLRMAVNWPERHPSDRRTDDAR